MQRPAQAEEIRGVISTVQLLPYPIPSTVGHRTATSMAASHLLRSSLGLVLLPSASGPPQRRPELQLGFTTAQPQRRLLRTIPRVTETDFLGDFGARDPFPAELESQFGEKVLGNVNTEHKILIPNSSALSLAEQQCSPVSPLQPPMSADDATKLLRKVVGWRLIEEDCGLKLQCLWKLRDFKCGVELINRIYNVVEPTGHFPSLHLEQPNQVRAELWTDSIGGLSMNDFIVAAKIDLIKTSDLVPKKRVWA